LKRLEGEADEVIALEQPDHLFAIGAYYREFAPVSDAEVVAILSGHGPAAGR
jgi:predicted phosphoribosyltransferase